MDLKDSYRIFHPIYQDEEYTFFLVAKIHHILGHKASPNK
jgi:hypothetical protein